MGQVQLRARVRCRRRHYEAQTSQGHELPTHGSSLCASYYYSAAIRIPRPRFCPALIWRPWDLTRECGKARDPWGWAFGFGSGGNLHLWETAVLPRPTSVEQWSGRKREMESEQDEQTAFQIKRERRRKSSTRCVVATLWPYLTLSRVFSGCQGTSCLETGCDRNRG